ncbi:alpha-ribazole phosphatase [Aquimarina muelleri]|uniref:Alpha-ribazole phosphatase n=1 Tax=Aquimarina muelleri TaxID=279356 RepID=A0A918JY27_9FLAO|nr:alpha-ribazole phosphatase [Aquimarina muelleri]MCX2763695.1 alpha-ribazole phosphatase [Aquimarina muelleri]GGX30392.1 alpha-ribazole phosphatase [Aquimarina muelleri]
MEIYLVRHTSPNIEKGICYGQSDIGITNSFASEVEKIHQQIPVTEISRVYSSPLQRCKLLAKTFNMPFTTDPRLKEMDFGDWELQAWDDIPTTQLNPWMKSFVTTQVPNGESYVMLQDRILNFYNSLHIGPEEKIVVVTHAGPMRALLAHIRKIELKDSFTIKIGYGDVIVIPTLPKKI